LEFINETDWPAEIFRNELEENIMYNSVLARIRYKILNDNSLVPLTDGKNQLKDIRREPIEQEFGTIEPDLFFPRTGTDVIIIGYAMSINGYVDEMLINVSAGPYNESLKIIGDRVWEKNFFSKQLTPTKPEPFIKMPVKYQLAFGGVANHENGEVPNPYNPIGKGYYLSKNEAIGKPLPNIEDPHNLISVWKKPQKKNIQEHINNIKPVGFAPYPSNWALRLQNIIKWEENIEEIDPNDLEELYNIMETIDFAPENGLFDRAHPKLSGKKIMPGQTIMIKGMSKNGLISFDIPKSPFEVFIELEDEKYSREMVLEEIFIDLINSYVDLSYRKLFDYEFIPHQTRITCLKYKD